MAGFGGVLLLSMAPARLAKVCTTSFGCPVVPEVRRIHSVWCSTLRSSLAGAILGLHVMKHATLGTSGPSVGRSDRMASTAAESMTRGRCSNGKSEGQRTRRRATPSSSMSASAAVSWSLVETSTDRPRSSPARPPRHDPRARSPSVTVAPAAKRARPDRFPRLLTAFQSDAWSLGGIFVKLDELSHGHGKARIFGGAEWFYSQHIFEPGDNDRDAQRVKS